VCLINYHFLETAMGTKLDSIPDIQSKSYIKGIKLLSELLIYRMMRIWYYPLTTFYWSEAGKKQKKVLETLHKFTNDVIGQRRILRPFSEADISTVEVDGFVGSKKRMAMLDLLLVAENEGQIDQSGIREEVDTFTFEVIINIFDLNNRMLSCFMCTIGLRTHRFLIGLFLVGLGC
jgi:cytochrome P450 family 4